MKIKSIIRGVLRFVVRDRISPVHGENEHET